MKKLFVITGGTGFVGSSVVKILRERGEDVRVLVRSEEKCRQALGEIDYVVGDVRNPSDLDRLLDVGERECVLIHTVAVVDIGTTKITDALYTTNVLGTKNVIEACLKHKVLRMLYVSSVHALTEPRKGALTLESRVFDPKTVHGGYAKTKAEATALVFDAIENRGLDAVIVHPSGIAGPNDFGNTHLTQMVIDYNKGNIPVAVKGGYDFVDVRDVAYGIVQACELAPKGESYILSNKYYSVKDVLAIMSKVLNKKPTKTTLPMWVARVGLPFLWLYAKARKQRPLYTAYSLYALQSNSNFSYNKAKEQLGYTARDLEQTIADTCAFLKEQGRI